MTKSTPTVLAAARYLSATVFFVISFFLWLFVGGPIWISMMIRISLFSAVAHMVYAMKGDSSERATKSLIDASEWWPRWINSIFVTTQNLVSGESFEKQTTSNARANNEPNSMKWIVGVAIEVATTVTVISSVYLILEWLGII